MTDDTEAQLRAIFTHLDPVPPLLDEAARNAFEWRTVDDELALLVVHGVLHLIGLDHIADADAERMEAIERTVLASLGIADPYADDAEGPG